MAKAAGKKSSSRQGLRPQSLPPCKIQIVTSSDSGLDSGLDSSPASSTKSDCDVEDVDSELQVSPLSYLLGESEPDSRRIHGINQAIEWIRAELQSLKMKDKELAKAMINIRSKIQEMKVQLELSRDKGYDSDAENGNLNVGKEEYRKQQWSVISRDSAFSTDNESFDNNKRATWLI